MKHLIEASSVTEIKKRIERLLPDSERQWGSMSVPQMMAHCSAWMEMAGGLNSPPRNLLGRLVGRFAKKSILNEEPIPHNMPSEKSLIVGDARQFSVEHRRLLEWVERFSAGGPERCTVHPHMFFGPMTPTEWAVLAYKHLDHHLRQFGV